MKELSILLAFGNMVFTLIFGIVWLVILIRCLMGTVTWVSWEWALAFTILFDISYWQSSDRLDREMKKFL